MAHRSDASTPLTLREYRLESPDGLSSLPRDSPAVWLFPMLESHARWTSDSSATGLKTLTDFLKSLPEPSVVCVLARPARAAEFAIRLEEILHFRLWIAVKRAVEKCVQPGQLPERHDALLVFSKSSEPLRHTLTRVAYSYCPACDKTTKDYGGKKHLYHEYGTLMSDVWRDMVIEPGRFPLPVAERLQDLFGLPPFTDLHVVYAPDPGMPANAAMEGGTSEMQTGVSEMNSAGETDLANVPPVPVGSALPHGDCLERLRDIPDGSVDFCFADPPYNICKTYDALNDARETEDYFAWCDAWLGELARVLKPGRTLAVLNIPLWSIRHFRQLRTLLRFQHWIAWDALSLPMRKIMPAHYGIVCFSKGVPRALPGLLPAQRASLEADSLAALREGFCLRPQCVEKRRASGVEDREPVGDLWWDIHRLKHNSRRTDHPCQLPPALMHRLIALFTGEGEIVLDPFNGAGTTTLAAAQLGRRYVGIELSSEYHEIARRRHKELEQGLDPFAKQAGTPAAKNSRVKRQPKRTHPVSKKQLQLEIKRIAGELGRPPTLEEAARHTGYPASYFVDGFADWGEACAAVRATGMSEVRPAAPAESESHSIS